MTKKVFLILMMFLPFFLQAQQITDDFEDGNLDGWTESTAGHWAASTDNPLTGSYSLHHILDTNASSKDMISLPLTGFDLTNGTTTWQFTVRHGYNPSSSNDWAVFLISDQPASEMFPSGSANGYAIGVDYSGTDDTLRLWKISSGSAYEVIKTSIDWEEEIGTSAKTAIQVTRTATGDWTVYVDTTTADFSNLVQTGATVNNTDYTTANYFGVFYEYSPSQDMKLWIDDVSITGSNTNDNTSTISAGSDTEPATISSLVNSADGVEVFDFNITDAGTSDGLPTIINSLTITQGDANDVPDWTKAIAGAKLFGTDLPSGLDGTVNPNGIVFNPNGAINVANNSTETYKLYIWLNTDLSQIQDNDNLEFKLDYTSIVADPSGSYFNSGSVESGDNNNAISIVATNLQISNYPPAITLNNDFTLSVKATDINGNLDLDATNNVTLQAIENSGTLSSSVGLSHSLVAGQYTWNDLQYNELDTFKIVADATNLTPDTTDNIICSTYLFYLDDNFEDGDLDGWQANNADRWEASDIDALDGNYSLHHIFDNSSSDIDAISYQTVPVDLSADSLIWKFKVKYTNQSPSGSNNWNVFLVADADNQQMFNGGAINGYVFGINFSGTSDTAKLWRVDNGTPTQIAQTNLDWNQTNADTIKAFVISRSATGNWEIRFNENGDFNNLSLIGSGNDDTYTSSDYFGVVYKYSSTQDRKLWIDDVYFGQPIPDLTPPVIVSAKAITPSTVVVDFNEDLDPTSAQTTSNYTINNSIGNPQTATLNGNKTVTLVFSNSFQDSVNYALTVQNVQDKAGNAIVDTTVSFTWLNLALAKIKLISANRIDVIFNKNVDLLSATDTSNYQINNEIGYPSSATVDANDSNVVHLYFANEMQNGTNYILHIQDIKDKLGNLMNPVDYPFVFYLIQPFDVAINELMIDVSPAPAALPPYKYIELYNKTDFNFDATGWTLTIGTSSSMHFPDSTIIPANGYVIICSEDAESDFTAFGLTVPILRESYLTSTTGKMVRIIDADDNIIDEVTYSPDWYGDPDKENGGWSLERIDPSNVCNQDGNWRASENDFGGTPGFQNSVYGSNPDNEHPHIDTFYTVTSADLIIDYSEIVDTAQAAFLASYLLNGNTIPFEITYDSEDRSLYRLHFLGHFIFGENTLKIKGIRDYCGNVLPDTTIHFTQELIHPVAVEPVSNNQLLVKFSEPVDKTTAEMVYNYNLDNGYGQPQIAFRNSSDTTEVYLLFENDFIEDTTYTLSVSGIKDVNGNVMNDEQLEFIYHLAKLNDIVINEVLFDPYKGGSDFVELYNRSKFTLYMNKLKIGTRNDTNGIDHVYLIANDHFEFHPGEYLVVTVDTANIKETYTTGGRFIQMSSMPSFPNDTGEVVILDDRDSIIDEFHYSSDMHFALLSSTEGVSLERIDFNAPTQDRNNWHSAAESVGFATPGLKNSQYKNLDSLPSVGKVSLEEDVFSPDDDGYQDQLYITYNLDNSGYVADIYIYNQKGYPVRHLVNNETIGDKGYWIWDGLDDNQRKVKIGIYAIVVKIFDLDGNVHVYKEACVVSSKK